ncbi:MAG: hypothetical protein ABSC13_08720 [Dehalococcoidia bacterium]|jgi:hypothetical protein
MADQLQREIEDLLNKLDDFIPEQKATTRLHKRLSDRIGGLERRLGSLFSRVSLGYLMIVSLVLIFVAFVFRSSTVGQYSLFVGLGLLAVTIVISFVTNRRAPEKRWRGQVVDLSQPGPLDRLQSWFKNRRNR